MKVQCDVCEKAEATVICCADEAALCERCDEKVHAANKLAGKHKRVAILGRSSSLCPTCDICQENRGYFFCLEDRAVLCAHCDDSLHAATSNSSSHQRFLITGARLALQHPTARELPEKKRFRAAEAPPEQSPLSPWADILAAGDLDQLYLRLASDPTSSSTH